VGAKVSEENEGTAGGPEGVGAGVDPVATAIALGGAGRQEANAFLKDQQALIADQQHLVRLQAKELAHELGLRHWSLLVRNVSSVLKLTLELAVGLLLLALVAGISLMVWNAAHSDGLVIEAFSVPPDMAAKGLSGQVIAGQLTDKLSQLQTATDSNRAARSYANDWGNDIKVEIPDTGVSIGEAYRFLKSWLGHETHVSGDVWRTPTSLVIAARVGGSGGSVTGNETELDSLIQKTAEDIYARTQPYRFAVNLARLGRRDEAEAIWRTLAVTGEPNDRGWAYVGLGVGQMDTASPAQQERTFQQAEPYGAVIAASNLALLENNLGRPERALAELSKVKALLRDGGGTLDPPQIPLISRLTAAFEQSLLGDNHGATQAMMAVMTGRMRYVFSPSYLLAHFQLLEHDVGGARKTLEHPAPAVTASTQPGNKLQAPLNVQMHMALETQDWKSVLAGAQALIAVYQKYPGPAGLKFTRDDPLTAIAEARLGKFADAERRVSPMPADCYPCLIARAQVALMQGQQARADFWFDRAVQSNPSIPMAYAAWGRAFLERHQPDTAIEKFKLANQKGPHFADPLEYWGEALMAKNQSHLALAKFAEAEKYAPNWGRLHLKWGEALVYAGKPDEAKKQFARAAQLDLTSAEKAELARLKPHV
jgi:tetratricopeptide (TPR) repeat protein